VIVDITGGQEGCDDYQVRLRIVQPTEEPCPPPLQEYGEDCVASLKYGKADGPISGAIQLYRMAYVDEPILLKATHADTDVLVIKCERTICDLLPEFDYGLPDPLAFTWSDEGAGGVFPLGKTGRGVVYVPPRGRDEVTIKCDVTDRVVRDKDVKEREKQPVAEIVIDLTFCEFDWLPEGGNATALTARIYEMHRGQCTFPGPARQITFDLSGVSEKPGYCVNRGTSRNPDLLFSVAANGAFHLCNDQKKEGAVPFHHRATSKARVTETTVTVASEDYGSYGLLGSSAFGAMPIEPRLDGSTTACRLGPNEVEIPRDDIPAAGGEVGGLQPGGNHIADVWDMRYPTHLHESADADTSVNNLYHGDGLERYEEYRGVDTNNDAIISYNANRTDQQELRSPQNERLSPNLKDLFVTTRRTADLPRLSYGRAYENARIVVHRFSGADRRKIDVIEIDISAGVPPTAAYTTPAPANQRTDQDGHLNKLLTPVQTMSWTTDWMGGSNTGSATTYGRPLIFNRSIDGYFDDRPYVDANGNAWHDWPDRPGVEDDNDNGVLDAGEDDNNNGALDGDHLSIPLPGQVPFRSLAWGTAANRRNPYDADGNGQIWVDREYTKAEVTTHVTTHEMGHALGIGPPYTNQVNLLRFLTGSSLMAYNGQGHCDDARCVMYWRVNNWRRQDFLCSDCQSLLRVHND